MKKRTDPVPRRAARRAASGRRGAGFTLLEVLAAVAILGFLYVAFASFAIQGLRREGENERRIRASLLADRTLSDVEIGIQDGQFPSDTGDEFDEDEFHVQVELLPITGLEAADDPGLTTLLEGDLAALATDLHTVRVRVSWIEGAVEQEVTRITYAWDSGPLYEQLGVAAGQPAGAGGPNDAAAAAAAAAGANTPGEGGSTR